MGIIAFPTAHRALSVIPLYKEGMSLVCRADHPLALRAEEAAAIGTQRTAVQAADLGGLDFIAFDPSFSIRRVVDRALRKRKVAVNIVMEFDNVETIKQAIEIGAGVAILPESAATPDDLPATLAVLPLAMPELVRPIGVVVRRGRQLTPAARKFLEVLRSESANRT
jgi:DNA-binding transcriptional LysR family regulator